MEELNVLLAGLADDGRVDSSGQFTLSHDKALEKLAAYRLVDPALFVLNLVAAAVTSGARSFAVETHSDRTTLRYHPQRAPTQAELEGLMATILEPQAPATLRELALAVHSAQALPGKPVVRLTAGQNAQSLYELTLGEGEPRVRPAPISGPAGVTVEIEFRERNFWSQLFGVGPRFELLSKLYHFCRHAPLDLLEDGRPKGARVTLGVFEPEVFAWAEFRGSQPLKVANAERRSDLFQAAPASSSAASSFVIALADPERAKKEGFLLISRGVAFRRPSSLLGCPLACAAVTADHLEKNLSQSDLVEDERFEALVALVREQVDKLVMQVCANPPAWSPKRNGSFSGYLKSLPSPDEKTRLAVDAFHRLSDIDGRCATFLGVDEQVRFLSEMTVSLPEQAPRFRKDLIRVIERKASTSLAQLDWRQGHGYLRHLESLVGPRYLEIRAAALLLDGQAKEAAEALAGLREASDLVLLLHGPPIEANSLTDIFLRFEMAVDQRRIELAQRLALQLEKVCGSSFLYLWLGWFALSRNDGSGAAALWQRAIEASPRERRAAWRNELWPELRGRVDWATQVHWMSRLGIERLALALRSETMPPKLDWSPHHPPHPIIFAKYVWTARKRGDFEEARKIFLEVMLQSLLAPHELRLEPIDSPYLPYSVLGSPAEVGRLVR